MDSNKNRWWIVVPTAVVVLVINVAISVLYIVAYSYLIDPGHDEAYYQAYAQLSAPYSSIIAGMPLMFLAGRWAGNKFSKGNSIMAALLVWFVYFLIDIAVLILIGTIAAVALLFAISLTTKLIAAYLGGRAAQNRGAYLRR